MPQAIRSISTCYFQLIRIHWVFVKKYVCLHEISTSLLIPLNRFQFLAPAYTRIRVNITQKTITRCQRFDQFIRLKMGPAAKFFSNVSQQCVTDHEVWNWCVSCSFKWFDADGNDLNSINMDLICDFTRRMIYHVAYKLWYTSWIGFKCCITFFVRFGWT